MKTLERPVGQSDERAVSEVIYRKLDRVLNQFFLSLVHTYVEDLETDDAHIRLFYLEQW